MAILSLLCVAGVAGWVIHLTARDARTRDRAWEKKEHVWQQERQQLLDRIMYLANHPWDVPTPREEPEPYIDPDDIPYDPLMLPLEPTTDDYYRAGSV